MQQRFRVRSIFNKEQGMHLVFLLTACVSIAAVVLICAYLLGNGIPTIAEIGLGNFFGRVWKPSKDLYGIFPMIVGSIYVTAGAIAIGVPIGLLTAVYLARFCPRGLYRVVKPAVDLIWLFWPGGDCASGAAAYGILWQGSADGLGAAGSDDFAHHCGGGRNLHSGSARELL